MVLFKRLGLKAQEAIMVFLRKGIYPTSKIEMMLEAAEEMKTKLLVESLDRLRGKPSEKVVQRLTKGQRAADSLQEAVFTQH